MTPANEDSLIQAFIENDFTVMREILKEGVTIGYLVNEAATAGDIHSLGILLEGGCVPEATDDGEPCPTQAILESRISKAEAELFSVSIEKLAAIDPSITNVHAGENGFSSVLSACFDKGLVGLATRIAADNDGLINIRHGAEGRTLLSMIAGHAKLDEASKKRFIRDLVMNGAAPKTKDSNGISPAQHAEAVGHADVAAFIKSIENIPYSDIKKQVTSKDAHDGRPTILIVGLLNKQFEIVSKSIGNGAKLELISSEGLDATRLRERAKRCDEVILVTNFVSHSHLHVIESAGKRPIMVNGGIDTVTRSVESTIEAHSMRRLVEKTPRHTHKNKN